MSATAQQIEWLQRVLGVSTPDIETELLPIWSAAKDSIDNQIGEFQNMLRKVGGDTAIEIADHGLGGLAGRWNVRLMAALLQYDDHDGANRGAVAQSLLKACQMTRNEVTANPVLAMLERNPFGVAITIRAVINRAISKIEGAVNDALH